MKTETYRSLLSITFCVLLLFLLPASLAFAEENSESAAFPFQIDDHGIMTLEGSGPLDAEAFAELNEDARLSVLAVSVPEGVTEISQIFGICRGSSCLTASSASGRRPFKTVKA